MIKSWIKEGRLQLIGFVDGKEQVISICPDLDGLLELKHNIEKHIMLQQNREFTWMLNDKFKTK